MRSRKRYHRKSNIRHDVKIAAYVIGGLAVLGAGYYFYTKSKASPQLPPASTPTPSA
jgi:hypothetical protein